MGSGGKVLPRSCTCSKRKMELRGKMDGRTYSERAETELREADGYLLRGKKVRTGCARQRHSNAANLLKGGVQSCRSEQHTDLHRALCRDDTLHGGDCEVVVGVEAGQLVFELYGHIA